MLEEFKSIFDEEFIIIKDMEKAVIGVVETTQGLHILYDKPKLSMLLSEKYGIDDKEECERFFNKKIMPLSESNSGPIFYGEFSGDCVKLNAEFESAIKGYGHSHKGLHAIYSLSEVYTVLEAQGMETEQDCHDWYYTNMICLSEMANGPVFLEDMMVSHKVGSLPCLEQ